MQYAGIIKNDFSAGPGVCVSFFVQGCPIKCKGCHNPQTWDFYGGKEFTPDTMSDIIEALVANDVHRDLCIMGGEPLCTSNQFLTLFVIKNVKEALPDTKIYLWTGYNLDEFNEGSKLKDILSLVDCIVDGPFIESEKDLTLPMRGSRNQRILYRGKDF